MLVSTSVPNLINGVSQQAENLRFPSQCEEQENGYSSILEGLTKRPPTKHIATLAGVSGTYKVDSINRSATQQYTLLLGDQSLRVFDLNGTEIPVKNAAGAAISSGDLAYLHTSTPQQSLKALTLADYTILLNREKTVAMSSTTTAAYLPSALVFVKQVRRGSDFTLKLYDDNTAITTNTPSWTFTVAHIETNIDATTGSDPRIADQAAVIAALKAALAASGANALYNHFSDGPLLYLDKKDNSEFKAEVVCTLPEGMAVFKDSTASFSLLPKRGWVHFALKVKGDPETNADDYYVRYEPMDSRTPEGTFAEGSWVEFTGGGLRNSFDPTTLPHALKNFGTYFQFVPLDWASRSCGDADSNPEPSFVGKQIRDVFFHRNRLGLLADENEIFSEGGEFFNFWRTTVIQLLDNDPIDVSGNGAQVALLNSAIPMNKELVLWADRSQFISGGGDLLTPKTVSIAQTSEFENLGGVPPRSLGNSIYFPFKRGQFSGFSEYAINTDSGLFEAADVTEHAPNYIQGVVEYFDLSDLLNLLVAKAGPTDTLYAYSFFKSNNERLQSAWGKWTFGGTIKGYYLLNTALYLVIERGSATCFEKLDLSPGSIDDYSTYVSALDRRITESGTSPTYSSFTNQTSYTLPYTPDSSLISILTRSTASVQGGVAIPVVAVTGSTIKVTGNQTAKALWIGEKYALRYRMTRPLMREQRGNGNYVVVPGRFQVRYGMLAYNDSAYFRVLVTPLGRATFVYEFLGRQLGTDTAITGAPPIPADGVKRFPVFSKNDQVTIEIINDSPLPCALLSVDWEALYTARAQRL